MSSQLCHYRLPEYVELVCRVLHARGIDYYITGLSGNYKQGNNDKGGRIMPFDEKARDAAAVAMDARGEPIDKFDGQTLQLNRYKIVPTGKFGNVIKLYCQHEDGEEVIISTFSEVVQRQADEIEGKLPVLITISQVGNYFKIY